MAICHGFINIYRSGYFHTAGKIGAYDRHPGDIYPTFEAAFADINPANFYVTTIPIQWEEEIVPPVNLPRFNEVVEDDATRVYDLDRGEYIWLSNPRA